MPFLNPAAMIAAYGSYYKDGNINSQNLHKQIMTVSETKALFPTRQTDNTRIDEVNMSLTSVLQPFYSKFSSLGALDFTPNYWNLDRVKINVRIKPDDLSATALDFMVQKGLYRKEAPVIAMVAEYLLQKAKEDDEESVMFLGVRKDPTTEQQAAGTPGAVVDSRTGIRHKIRLYNAAGKFSSLGSMIAMGAVPTDPVLFVTYMETYYYAIPEKYRKFIKWFSMSKTLETRFKRGMRLKYNANYPQATDFAVIIDTMVQVRGFTSHESSDMIWTTVDGNQIGRIKNPSNANVFDMATEGLYDVIMGTDWYEGYDFINPTWIWTNGRDLTIPS